MFFANYDVITVVMISKLKLWAYFYTCFKGNLINNVGKKTSAQKYNPV